MAITIDSTVEEVLANPSHLRLPDRGDLSFAILTAIITAATERLTQERWSAAWYVLKLAEQGKKTSRQLRRKNQ